MEFNFNEVVKDLRRNFNKGCLRSVESRLREIKGIHDLLIENEDAIFGSLHKDLNKCKVEANFMEVMQVKKDLGECFQKLEDWMMPVSVSPDLLNVGNRCEIRSEPKGVVLIIGPWNYPLCLILAPLAGALAAGNTVIVKPSELAPHVENLFVELIPKYLDPNCVRVITGGVQETTALLRERFDHIFYTGGPMVARIVMRAASEYLTPVTLELGGKCPAVVANNCDFDTIAQRITWGKLCNSGQTCLSVDYILAVDGCEDKIVDSLKKAVYKFYGSEPKKSSSYGRMINERHFKRVEKLINQSKVVFGGETDQSELYIAPTIMCGVTAGDDVMKEEIFGPLLPIIPMDSVDDAIAFINDRDKPLAVYTFSKDNQVNERVITQTSSGGACVNDALIHAAVPNLPFGGVGESGMGSYHGKASFDVFSHKKSCLIKNQCLEFANSVRYPPYDEHWKVLHWAEWFLVPSLKRKSKLSYLHLALLGVFLAIVCKFVFKI